MTENSIYINLQKILNFYSMKSINPYLYGIWGSNTTTQQILLCSSLLLIAVLGSFSFRRKILLFPWKWLLLRRKVWKDPSTVHSVSQYWKAFISFFPIGCLQGGVNMSQKLWSTKTSQASFVDFVYWILLLLLFNNPRLSHFYPLTTYALTRS